MRDFYSILGVKRDAGADEIKAAWRRQAKSAHPDQNPDDPLAHSRFAEIGHAYDILKDPAKRRRYDQSRVKPDALDRDNTIMKQREAARAAAERAQQAKANAERVMAELAEAEAEKARADAAAAQAAQNARNAQAAANASRAAQSAAQAAAQAAAQTASASQAGPQAAAADRAKTTRTAEDVKTAGGGAQKESSDKAESPEEMVSRIFGEGPEAAAAADSIKREREAADAAAANGSNRQAIPSLLSPIELFTSLVRRLRGVPDTVPEKAPDVFAEAIVAIGDLLEQKSVPLTLNDGRDVRVPLKGVTDGHVVRLREQGLRLPGMNRGDVAVTVRVARSERFVVDGFDLRTVLPITLENAVLGCETEVEGPEGKVPLTVPAWSNSDQVIRIEDLGLPNGEGGRGGLVVEVRVMLWEKPDEKVTDLMRLMREGLYI
ncbi:DnaJ domain-containing protein [Rhizobium sp. G187]|uniref:DnaJ domain-containing protein n=1 Tax=unclassified Rhizobium TaxID=2613769 RepID=UPI0006B94605|nr:DnaJ domain-containing protein [Rhizobium sp. AAP43]KPF46780.1 molecular chaperone DnaJ [Rhizobium sp. AAP43]